VAMLTNNQLLRSFWQKMFSYGPSFGWALIFLFGVPRFILVLQANVSGNYTLIPIIFILMWVAPLIILTRKGRRYIGIAKPKRYYWLVISFFLGVTICFLFYFLSLAIFGHDISNSFVYISKSYNINPALTGIDKLVYFVIYSITAVTFSPVGEELFYRGIVHGSFVERLGHVRASFIDSSAFAITHLAHFGIIYHLGGWDFLIFPSLLWLASMFAVSQLFFLCRIKSGTLLGAIICHAGYNLAMMYVIFYQL
jgi:uncharacterized protein